MQFAATGSESARARHDKRTWQVERRNRTRHLIELDGLVAKGGIVNLTGDDRAIIYGALIRDGRQAPKASKDNRLAHSGPKGEGGVRDGTEPARWGVTDGGRRGDLTYRSAARHSAALLCLSLPNRAISL
jgi:hypothetical protein